jgi:hypothetical protein
VDEGVQSLLVISLRVDEFLLNDEFLAIVEDVHYKVRGDGCTYFGSLPWQAKGVSGPEPQ